MIYYILCVCVCIYIYVCMYVCIYPSIQSCVCTSGFQKGRDKFPALSVCPALCLLLALPVARLLFLPPSLPPFLPPSLPPSLSLFSPLAIPVLTSVGYRIRPGKASAGVFRVREEAGQLSGGRCRQDSQVKTCHMRS